MTIFVRDGALLWKVVAGEEVSAAASGDRHEMKDALVESLLNGPHTVLPAKQWLFAGAKAMVENLL